MADGGAEDDRSPAARLEGAAARALGRLPAWLQRRLAGGRAVVVDGQTLDPGLQLLLALRRRRTPYGWCEPTVPEARARSRRDAATFGHPRTPVGAARDLTIPGGGAPLRARHYAPAPDDSARPAPLLVYFHGGGYVVGDVDTHDEACRLLCRHAAAHVLSVDYRVAPEHPFPAAIDDAHAALRWARAHAASLGADPARVAVGGDSAGGTLATVVAREAAPDERPAAQLLIYPATDSETPRPSWTLFDEGFALSRRDRAQFARHYMAGTGARGGDPRISPLLAPDLSGLPPALVVVAGFDILRDEGEAYAAALRAAGNTVELRRAATLAHAFVNMTTLCPAAERETIAVARAWRALLDGLAAPAPAGAEGAR